MEMKTTVLKTIVAGTLALSVLHPAEIIIKTAPPAPVSVAVIGRAPSARHIWVPGYYKGVGGRYAWVPGQWMVPPRAGAVWVPPRWIQKPNGYLFVKGHWR
jgi:hypothetical protein